MAEEKKSPGKLIALLAFLPWLVYAFASVGNHWAAATVGGEMACLVYLAVLRQFSTIKLMDWTTLAFFIAASIVVVGLHSNVLATWQVMIIWSFYAVAAWGSIAIGRPFTVAYAREQQPREVWDLPIFHRMNRILTLFWCALFTVNVGFGVVAVAIGDNFGKLVPGFLIPTALLVYGFVFSARFPPRYVQRVNARAAATAENASTA